MCELGSVGVKRVVPSVTVDADSVHRVTLGVIYAPNVTRPSRPRNIVTLGRRRAPSLSLSTRGPGTRRQGVRGPAAQPTLRAFQTSSHGHRRAQSSFTNGNRVLEPSGGRSSDNSSTSNPEPRSTAIISPCGR